MIRIALFTTFCLVFANLFSQGEYLPGYYITNSGDTISGYILNQGDIGNSKNCLYKETEKDQAESFKPGEILSYNISGFRYYQSMELPVEGQEVIVFAEYLVDGVADFYYFRDITGNHFYIKTEGNVITELPATELRDSRSMEDGANKRKEINKYSGIIKYYMKDQPSLFNKIDQLSLKKEDLIEIADKYHDLACTDGSECYIFSTQLEERKSGFSVYMNFPVQNLDINLIGYEEFFIPMPTNIPGTGIEWYTNLPNLNKHIYIISGIAINFLRYNNSRFFYNHVSFSEDIHQKLNFCWIGPTLDLRYDFLPNRKFSPWFSLGSSVDFIVFSNTSEYFVRTYKTIDLVDSRDFNHPEIGQRFIGYNMGIGTSFSVFNRNDFSFSAKYSKKLDATDPNWGTTLKGLLFSLNYNF